MKRQEILEMIQAIFDECDKRNTGSNEVELDQQETIANYIIKSFTPKKVDSAELNNHIEWINKRAKLTETQEMYVKLMMCEYAEKQN